MAGGIGLRRIVSLAALVIGEIAGMLTVAAVLAGPASAQLFDDRFPFLEERYRRRQEYQRHDNFNPFGQPERQSTDYSKAPPPKKQEGTPLTSVVVMGDSIADWLAYGLEIAASESPDIGIVRKHKTLSGLIRTDVKNDPRGEYPDWPQAVREILNQEKANFVVFTIGLADRRSIREKPPERPVRGAAAPAQQSNQQNQQAPASQAQPKPADNPNEDAEQSPGGDPVPGIMVEREPAASSGTLVHEFRSEKWAELYSKRIDETIAALKSKNVPVFWVGLPPIRGTKSMSDVGFLNDLYRSRAEKAGITYIDVWDGFVDEQGRFVTQGPDFEGQIRRLRTSDGAYFTEAGARKLAHYVERELQRAMVSRATPVALPTPEEPVQQAPAAKQPGAAIARPLAGPVVPLSETSDSDELAGGSASRRTTTDAVANRVLLRGEPMAAPAGRSDDFTWPPRGVAPVGADPAVATTTLPMTPMQPEKSAVAAAPAPEGDAAAKLKQAREGVARPRVAQQQPQQRPDQRRSAPQPEQRPAFYFPFFRRW